MAIEQYQIECKHIGFIPIEQLLSNVENEIKEKGYGEGWYLRKLEMLEQGEYLIVVERNVE